jgi:hypothetical protein
MTAISRLSGLEDRASTPGWLGGGEFLGWSFVTKQTLSALLRTEPSRQQSKCEEGRCGEVYLNFLCAYSFVGVYSCFRPGTRGVVWERQHRSRAPRPTDHSLRQDAATTERPSIRTHRDSDDCRLLSSAPVRSLKHERSTIEPVIGVQGWSGKSGFRPGCRRSCRRDRRDPLVVRVDRCCPRGVKPRAAARRQ